MAASIPKYVPLPLPGGSVAGLQRTGELASQKFESYKREKTYSKIGDMFPNLVE
jgi:hypothetical protein